MEQLLLKTFCQFLKKLNVVSPYDLAIPLLGIYPKELKAGIRTDTYMTIFTASLFTSAKMWTQPRCPLMGE